MKAAYDKVAKAVVGMAGIILVDAADVSGKIKFGE